MDDLFEYLDRYSSEWLEGNENGESSSASFWLEQRVRRVILKGKGLKTNLILKKN